MLDPNLYGQLLWLTWPVLIGISITAIGWFVLIRFAREKGSRGLFIISVGLLVDLVLSSSWYVYYWIVFGGPWAIFQLRSEGLSYDQIQALSSLVGLIGTVISLASWSVLITLLIYGAVQITSTSQTFKEPMTTTATT